MHQRTTLRNLCAIFALSLVAASLDAEEDNARVTKALSEAENLTLRYATLDELAAELFDV